MLLTLIIFEIEKALRFDAVLYCLRLGCLMPLYIVNKQNVVNVLCELQ